MKSKLNLYLILIILLSNVTFVFAQQAKEVEFAYDKSGNRTIRQIVNLKMSEESISGDSTSYKEIAQITGYSEIIADQKVSVFPNPTAGLFKVVIDNFNENLDISLFLHTISGILIYKAIGANYETPIDIRNRENGAYILTVVIAGKRKTWKIIKN